MNRGCPEMINKRNFFRVEVLKSVNIHYNGGYYKGKLVELSAGGAKIKCRMNLMENELFDLSLKINGLVYNFSWQVG